MTNNIEPNYAKYQDNYSDNDFWDKVKEYAKSAGESVLELALKLYYAAKDEDTPIWAKTTIYGALGYFILPVDLIPDVLPGVGFTDDLSILSAAVITVAVYIKDEHIKEAKDTLKKWFN